MRRNYRRCSADSRSEHTGGEGADVTGYPDGPNLQRGRLRKCNRSAACPLQNNTGRMNAWNRSWACPPLTTAGESTLETDSKRARYKTTGGEKRVVTDGRLALLTTRARLTM